MPRSWIWILTNRGRAGKPARVKYAYGISELPRAQADPGKDDPPMRGLGNGAAPQRARLYL